MGMTADAGQPSAGGVDEFWVNVDGEDVVVTEAMGQQDGVVAGAGPDLQDPLTFADVKVFEHVTWMLVAAVRAAGHATWMLVVVQGCLGSAIWMLVAVQRQGVRVVRKARQTGVGTVRAGPSGSLESRTSTRSSAGATWTQAPSFVL